MIKNLATKITERKQTLRALGAILAVLLLTAAFRNSAAAQDQDQDDPPGRVARLGYMEGSVSFQPAGENDWVQAVPNRPMTTGDKLWADRDSRAEIQLGSATIDLAPNTGFSFLNLDDRTIQVEVTSGSINARVWDLDRDNVFEIDTANQAFTVSQPGRYRVDASEDGNNTVVTVREGEGESTGNGQSYTMRAGQRFTFSGTNSLNAEVDQISGPDDFDNWSDRRERRYQDSPSARYCDRRVVGFQDLDDNGDWRSTPDYGYAWFPRVNPGWAPYHDGHWAWIDPWGWTWVDDNRWGYAPFHYGRWAFVTGRWGWIPGPREVRPVYAPALVAFVGGGFAAGATVAWFPLGPREVYVPSYRVSPAYVNRVNVTNTTVNQTTITNVYNTTIVNNNTTIRNVNYVNRNVNGAVTAVPQHAFANAQPVAQSAVRVNPQQLREASVSTRAAVPPARDAVLGPHANTAGRVASPPRAVISRPVVAKAAPPPPRPSFASRQQLLTQHPGQPVNRQELQQLRPANATVAERVKMAPPAKPATPAAAPNRPGNPAANTRPGGNPPPAANNRPQPGQPNEPPARNERPGASQPSNRPQPNQPANNRPPSAQPNNRPEAAPTPNNRPEPARPNEPPARNDRPPSAQPNNRPEAAPTPNNRPEPARPNEPPARHDRPPSAQPNNRPEAAPTPNNRPESARPNEPRARNDRPPAAQPNNRPAPNRSEPPARNEHPSEQPRTEPAPRNQNPPPSERPQSRQPEARPAPQGKQAPPEKKEQKKEDNKPH